MSPSEDTGGARRRPATVAAANLLLVLAATALAVSSITGLTYAEPVTEAFQRAYAGVEGVRFSVLSIRATGVILLVVAGGLVLLALFNQRGSATARIDTWMLGTLLVCWGGFSISSDRGPPESAPDPVALERMLAAAMPGWVDPVATASMSITVAAVLAAMVLLALPASHRFFTADPARRT